MARSRRDAPPRGARRWQMLAECVPQRPTVARSRRDAFSGCRLWRYFAVVRFRGVQSWRDYAVVRSREAIRGSFFASCVPEGASDGKSASSRQHIAAMHPKRAGFGKICAPCIRKAPQIAVGGYTARRSCQERALFAARAPQIMHGAQILPFLGAPFERFNLSQAGAVLAVRALPPCVRPPPAHCAFLCGEWVGCRAPPCMRPCAQTALLGLPAAPSTRSFFLPAALSSRPRRGRNSGIVSFAAENMAL